jgi:hypothetical protein
MSKVYEVIERLSEFDPQNEVIILDIDSGDTYDISDFDSEGGFVVIEVSA